MISRLTFDVPQFFPYSKADFRCHQGHSRFKADFQCPGSFRIPRQTSDAPGHSRFKADFRCRVIYDFGHVQ